MISTGTLQEPLQQCAQAMTDMKTHALPLTSTACHSHFLSASGLCVVGTEDTPTVRPKILQAESKMTDSPTNQSDASEELPASNYPDNSLKSTAAQQPHSPLYALVCRIGVGLRRPPAI